MKMSAMRLAVAGMAWMAALPSPARAQAPGEISPTVLGQLMGFVQNAYFNANRIGDMPRFPKDRAATQAEILAGAAAALRLQHQACSAVVDADYADDSGNRLAVRCAEGSYLIDAQRGTVLP